MHAVTPPPSLVSDACSVSPWAQMCLTEVSLLRKPLLLWGKDVFFIWISNCGFVFRSKLSSDLDSEKSTRGGKGGGGMSEPIFKCSNVRAVEEMSKLQIDQLVSFILTIRRTAGGHTFQVNKICGQRGPRLSDIRSYLVFD